MVTLNHQNGMLNVESETDENISSLSICDLTGKLRLLIADLKSNYVQADLSVLERGLYFIRIRTANKVSMSKLVIGSHDPL
jgi:hypothetical protein